MRITPFMGVEKEEGRSTLRPDQILLWALDFDAVKLNIIPVTGIIESSQTYFPPDKSFIFCSHDRLLHVIPINLNQAACDPAFDFNGMPFGIPWGP